MCKIFNFLFQLLIINFLINSQILANTNEIFNPSYVAVDAVVSKMPMPRPYGGNIFNKTTQGINLAFGQMLNKYFGIELGSSILKHKTKFSTTYYPEFINGIQIDDVLDVYELNKTTLKRAHYYLGVTSKLFISHSNCINLLVGASLIKTKATTLLIETDADKDIFLLRNYNKNQVRPILKIGLENKLANNLGLTVSAWWINAKRQIAAEEKDSATFIKIKNITNISIGLNYYL